MTDHTSKSVQLSEELRSYLSGQARPELNMAIPRDTKILCAGDDLRGVNDVGLPHAEIYKEVMGPFAVNLFTGVREHSLPYTRIPRGFYSGQQGKINAAVCVEHVLTGFGIKMSDDPRVIDSRLLKENQDAFLREAVKADRKTWSNFFYENGLSSAFLCLDHSHLSVFSSVFPWAFTWEPERGREEGNHIHPWDLQTLGLWTTPQSYGLALAAIRHTFERHLGLKFDEANGIIDPRLMPMHKTGKTGLAGAFGFAGLEILFGSLGLITMLRDVPQFKKCPYLAIKAAYPWIFDLTRKEHLHYFDFSEKAVFETAPGQEDPAAVSIRHVLESHLGLKMRPPAPGDPSFEIDERLFQGKIRSFLTSLGAAEWDDVLEDHLSFLHRVWDRMPGLRRNLGLTFAWAYPWAFDLSRPEGEHLHYWKIPLSYFWTYEDAAVAVKHEVNREGWPQEEIDQKATAAWLASVGLHQLSTIYGGKTALLKAVYPES